jgi:hypothetical protein
MGPASLVTWITPTAPRNLQGKPSSRSQSASDRLRSGPSWSADGLNGDRRMAGRPVQLTSVSVTSASARSMATGEALRPICPTTNRQRPASHATPSGGLRDVCGLSHLNDLLALWPQERICRLITGHIDIDPHGQARPAGAPCRHAPL